MALGTDVGLGPGHIVLDGEPAPLPQKGTEPPNFRPIFIVTKLLYESRWHLAWRWTLVQATLCWMGIQLPSLKRGQSPSPQFSAHFYRRQTAGCIKMPLGMEVGLGPGDFVFDGDPASGSYSQNRRHTHYHPVFGPRLLWPNGWMDEDATWYEIHFKSN